MLDGESTISETEKVESDNLHILHSNTLCTISSNLQFVAHCLALLMPGNKVIFENDIA